MAYFEWDSRLETGIDEIDEQHRALFALANDLHDAIEADRDRDLVENAVYALSEYVTQHFADEEALMERAAYPAIAEHRLLHHDLTAETLRIATRYFSGDDLLPTELAPFVASWLTQHIREVDTLVASHVRGSNDS